MFNVTGGELGIILVVALIVLGPEKLPGAIRKFGQIYGELRRMSSGFQDELREAFDEPTRELRETFESAKSQLLGGFDDSDRGLADAGSATSTPPSGAELDGAAVEGNEISPLWTTPPDAESTAPEPAGLPDDLGAEARSGLDAVEFTTAPVAGGAATSPVVPPEAPPLVSSPAAGAVAPQSAAIVPIPNPFSPPGVDSTNGNGASPAMAAAAFSSPFAPPPEQIVEAGSASTNGDASDDAPSDGHGQTAPPVAHGSAGC